MSRRTSPPARRGAIALLALLLAMLLIGYLEWGRPRTTLVDRTGDFGRVRVTESTDGLRTLFTGEGRARQSAVYPGRPEHLELAYSRVAMIGLALVPPDARILMVGLGGGAMPMYIRARRPRALVDVVEIDPLIVEVAQSHFGVRPDSLLRIHTGDGRAFIEAAPPDSYDLIILDAFSDDEIPMALSTRQFLEAVDRALVPDGFVVSNLWSSQGQYRSMVRTYEAVFPEVHEIGVGRGTQRIVVASQVPTGPEALVAAARRLSSEIELGFDLPEMVERGLAEAAD